MQLKPGTKIKIKINGEEIETRIDDAGVQRLPYDPSLHNFVLGHLNWIAEAVQRGIMSQKRRREIYQNIGYSVYGYAEIFPKDKIENPVWNETE